MYEKGLGCGVNWEIWIKSYTLTKKISFFLVTEEYKAVYLAKN